MKRFFKKRKLQTDEEVEDLRQPDEAAANGSDAIRQSYQEMMK